jgi:carnitine 3-dehydrogenase
VADDRPAAVGLLGGGVIGAGWAARFLVHGVDVRLYDPDPDAVAKAEAVVAAARRAHDRLTMVPLPDPGRLVAAASPEEAVAGAAFVQESAPEREPLKRDLLEVASRAAGADVVIASSTSGLRPTRLQDGAAHPERILVGHPFNPVYLLPLVEVCGGERTAPEAVARAAAVYRSVGMSPLIVRREIDGFVADRLLEALWREALWLVADGVATTAEIDDAIRLGAGLRWAFMGSFLTYRMAGGEEGMRHFLEQFGPALAWPWTKLTEVPDLDAGLIERIVAQSDEQADGRTLEELERHRDDCLVAVIQALRTQRAGAGEVLRRHELRLVDDAGEAAGAGDDDGAGPLLLHRVEVPPEWVDYNGHAHESRYLEAFADTTDALLRRIGVDAAYLASAGSYFTAETHLSHLGSIAAGDRVEVTTQVLGFDAKRLLVFHEMRRRADAAVVATAEQMLVHVDAGTGRAGPARDGVLARVGAIAARHADLPAPERAGRAIVMPGA